MSKSTARQRSTWTKRRRAFLRWWAQQYGAFVCRWCGRALDGRTVTVDHIVARADGGMDENANLTPACSLCNVRRSSRAAKLNNKRGRDEAKAWRWYQAQA